MGWTIPLLLLGCSGDSMYPEQSFTESVEKAYQHCDASEIRFLAAKENIQTAFSNCGANDFADFAWSPDGIHLYFRLPLTANLLDGQAKTIRPLPLEQPTGAATWIGDDLLVLPLPPPKGGEDARLVLYNLGNATLDTLELPGIQPSQLQPAGTRDRVYLAGRDARGQRSIYLADFSRHEVQPAFRWLAVEPDTFTCTPEQDVVAIGTGDTVTLYRGATGEVLETHAGARRGVLHPDGRYLALETSGDPISPFDQHAWDELSPEARERGMRRTKAWLDRQPDWVPRKVRPPELDIQDRRTGKRVRITGFYGDHFQWYPAPIYGSFLLWGLEGKEVNRNVALTNLAERLRMVAAGEMPSGLEPWEPEGTVSPGTHPGTGE